MQGHIHVYLSRICVCEGSIYVGVCLFVCTFLCVRVGICLPPGISTVRRTWVLLLSIHPVKQTLSFSNEYAKLPGHE